MSKHLLAPIIGALMALSPSLVAAAPRVAICGTQAATSTDVRTKLVATGVFASVDIISCDLTTPTLAQLKMYDAVYVWSGYAAFANLTTLGNNLADYVD